MANKQAKKPEKGEKPRLEIKTRTPQKSSGIFDNIGQNRGTGEHPLREILRGQFPAPVEDPDGIDRRPPAVDVDAHTLNESTPTSLTSPSTDSGVDAHDLDMGTPTEDMARRPLSTFIDVQDANLPTPNGDNLGHPSDMQDGAHDPMVRAPESGFGGRRDKSELDADGAELTAPTGPEAERPQTIEVDSKAPEALDVAPTEGKTDGARVSTDQKRGAHTPRNWAKVEEERKTGRANLRPGAELLRQFRIYCAGNDLTLTEFFELAGLRFMELGAQAGGEAGALAPFDDRRKMIGFDTDDPIINLYLAYTARFNEYSANGEGKWVGKWLARDELAAREFRDVDIRLIELGIIQTQGNKQNLPGKIHSFKYYVEEIRKVMVENLSDNTLDIMITHNRKRLARWFGKEIDLSFLELANE